MDEKMVSLRINGIPVAVPEGSTVLEAARSAGFNIPSLCFLKDTNEIGACRICVVKVKGAKSLVASCIYPVAEGMEIYTNTKRVHKSRQLTLELIFSNHRMDCLACSHNSYCGLLQLADDLGIGAVRYANDNMPSQTGASAPHLMQDNSKCVLCHRCTAMYRKTQEVGVIGPNDRGFRTHIGCASGRDLAEVDCISCDRCIVACPIDTLSEKNDTVRVLATLNNPAKHVVVGPAPSVRVTLGKCFGLPIGTSMEDKMVTALRHLGFDKMFDVDTTANFTILEEGIKFPSRLSGGSTLYLITSCSLGQARYLEQHIPGMIRNIFSYKSPQQMFGSLVKTYYAEQADMDPQDIFVVSIIPCTAKRYEVLREKQRLPNGYMSVNVSLATRELGHTITQADLLFERLPDGAFDPMLGTSIDAVTIFGASNGVMEVALRTMVGQLTGEGMALPEYQEVRGMEGVKEASYELPDKTARVCVAFGLHNIKRVLDSIWGGSLQYDFVEFMACPGDYIDGGGQPIQHTNVHNFTDIEAFRAVVLYEQGEGMAYRRSHENPVVQKVYADFLGEPSGHKAHAPLHCSYIKQKCHRV